MLLQLWGDILSVAVDCDMVSQLFPPPQDQVLPPSLGVKHFVPDPRVELVRVGLPGLVELERNLSVHAKTEVVVDHLEGKFVNSFLPVRLEPSVQRELQAPPVQVNHLSGLQGKDDLADRLVRVSASPPDATTQVVAGAQWKHPNRRRMV